MAETTEMAEMAGRADETGRVLQLLGPSTGGIRRHVGHLSSELAARGWDVEVAGPSGVLGGGIASQHHCVPIPSGLSPMGVLRARARLQAVLGGPGAGAGNRVGRDRGFDLVHAHGLKAGWLAATLRHRPPVLVTVHNVVDGEASGLVTPVLRTLETRLARRVETVVAASEEIGARLRQEPGGDRVVVVRPVGPPPRPQRSPGEVRAALGVGANQPLVVAVARLHPQKDLATLLRAMSRLRARVPDAVALVVGEGPQELELRELAQQLGLSRAVVFTGPRPNPADELAAADVVAVPSRWESGPLVVVEALTLGRPVVATPVGLVPELVVDGVSGRLVAVGDAEGMAGALGDVLEEASYGADMGREGQRRVAARLPPGHLVSLVEDAYRATLAGRR